MKTQFIKMLSIEIFLIIFALLNFLFARGYSIILYFVGLLIITLVLMKYNKVERRKEKDKTGWTECLSQAAGRDSAWGSRHYKA